MRFNIYHSLPTYKVSEACKIAQINGNLKVVKLSAAVLLTRYREMNK